jgi:hypothetical protein
MKNAFFRDMPRFYFHLFNDENVPDKEGEILSGPAAAIEAATGMARDMAAVSVRSGHLSLHHRIEVADEDGNIVANLRYGDVITFSK